MRFPLIQVFRGIAAMLVIMLHLIANSTNHLNYVTYGNFFNFGFIGVDFFFVLSGFIITYVHFSDLVLRKENSVSIFFTKRILRIYPIYWILAIITVIIYYKSTPIFMQEAGLAMDFSSFKTLKFLIESFLLIYNEKIRLIGVAWTLSYEMLFYVVFGIGIILQLKLSKVLAGVWLILIIIFAFKTPNNSEFINFIFNVVIIEFLFGCLVAYVIRRKINISYKILFPILVLSVILMFKTIHIQGLLFTRDIYNVVSMSIFFATVTYAAVKFDQKNSSFKFPSILILIGDASYSIYLSHNMFLSALTRLYAKINNNYLSTQFLPIICTVIFIITVFLGILIHLFLEKKILNYVNNLVLIKKN